MRLTGAGLCGTPRGDQLSECECGLAAWPRKSDAQKVPRRRGFPGLRRGRPMRSGEAALRLAHPAPSRCVRWQRPDAFEETRDCSGDPVVSPQRRRALPVLPPERFSSRTPLSCWKLPGPGMLPAPRFARSRTPWSRGTVQTDSPALTDARIRTHPDGESCGRRERDLGLPFAAGPCTSMILPLPPLRLNRSLLGSRPSTFTREKEAPAASAAEADGASR